MRGGEGGSAPPNPPETGPRGDGGPPKIFGKNAKKGLNNSKNGAEGAVLAKIWEFWKIFAPPPNLRLMCGPARGVINGNFGSFTICTRKGVHPRKGLY